MNNTDYIFFASLRKIGEFEVNSYHNQGCRKVVPQLRAMAQTEDGVVEAVSSEKYSVMATMRLYHHAPEPFPHIFAGCYPL